MHSAEEVIDELQDVHAGDLLPMAWNLGTSGRDRRPRTSG
jgi:hypothetical protein